MAEYIKRIDVMKICEGYSEHCFETNDSRGQDIADRIEDDIVALPTADVAEVKHGEWKWGEGLGGQYGIWCTNCGAGWTDSPNAEWIAKSHDYCPKCGARMDGGTKE